MDTWGEVSPERPVPASAATAPCTQRPEQLERPERPERPELPQLPELPQRPCQPQQLTSGFMLWRKLQVSHWPSRTVAHTVPAMQC